MHTYSELAHTRWPEGPGGRCLELLTMAQRELSAFSRAVRELFGAEQAELSAEDWLRELSNTDGLPASTGEWRTITAKAARELARRMNASSLATEFTNA